LIGAPLGSIIKKGGLGIPVLIGISFFIAYYVLSLIFEKWSKQGLIGINIGMWIPDLIYLPIGIFFLRQAKNDSRILETDYFDIIIDKVKTKFRKNSVK
jgi:lipopolysaccharide export system permease protein